MLTLHANNARIVYKNSILSFSFLFVLIITISAIFVPFYLTLEVNRNSWNHAVTTFEQPQLEFTHKFIYLAGSEKDLVTCSSFENYNTITSSYQRCSRIKFWNDDIDYDYIADSFTFQVSYDTTPPENSNPQFISLLLIFKARLNKLCPIITPAFMSIIDLPLQSKSGRYNELHLIGEVIFNQDQLLECPRMTTHKNGIDLNLSPSINSNSSNIEDYEIPTIMQRMKQTQSGYFTFNQKETLWRDGDPNKFTVTITIQNSRDLTIVYNKTVWQKIASIWLHYLSVLIPIVWLFGKCKDYLFGSGLISAWRLIPWSKCD